MVATVPHMHREGFFGRTRTRGLGNRSSRERNTTLDTLPIVRCRRGNSPAKSVHLGLGVTKPPTHDQASAFAFNWLNSADVMEPLSSSAFAEAI